jgi:hypothetical protein
MADFTAQSPAVRSGLQVCRIQWIALRARSCNSPVASSRAAGSRRAPDREGFAATPRRILETGSLVAA